MKQLSIPGASILMLMPFAYVAADSYASASFKIEVELTRQSAAQASYPVRCLEGCDWEATTIECPGGDRVCRAVIAARSPAGFSDQASAPPSEIRALSGTVCLGLGTRSIETALRTGELGQEWSGPRSGLLVVDVVAGSPADLAGFKQGDLMTSFNAVPVERTADAYDAVQATTAGQLFEATVDRNGTLLHIAGALGMLTTAGKCAPADARLLQSPAVTAADMISAPFRIVLFVPDSRFELTCLEGCTWGGLGMSRCPVFGQEKLCAIAADQQDVNLLPFHEDAEAFKSALERAQ